MVRQAQSGAGPSSFTAGHGCTYLFRRMTDIARPRVPVALHSLDRDVLEGDIHAFDLLYLTTLKRTTFDSIP